MKVTSFPRIHFPVKLIRVAFWNGQVLPAFIFYDPAYINDLANMARVMGKLPVDGIHSR